MLVSVHTDFLCVARAHNLAVANNDRRICVRNQHSKG